MACHGSHIALLDHARHVLFGSRFHPNRVTVEQQQVVSLRLRNDTATDGEHDIFLTVDHTLQAASLDSPVTRLTVEQKHLGTPDASLPSHFFSEFHQPPRPP